MIELDPIDRQILMILQRGIAIESRPYQAMADEIGGISEEDVIRRIARLKETEIIRRMSGFFDSRRLGYQSMLVAVKPLLAPLIRPCTSSTAFPASPTTTNAATLTAYGSPSLPSTAQHWIGFSTASKIAVPWKA